MKNLKELDLRSSNLAKIPKAIKNLPSLEWLRLDFNNIKEIPESILNINFLQCLDIRENPLDLRKSSQSYHIIQKLKQKRVHVSYSVFKS